MPHATSQLYVGEDLDEPTVVEFAEGRAAVFSRRAPHKESPNEDAAGLFAIDDHRGVLVVADGCGGMSSGDTASRIAVQSLGQSVESVSNKGAIIRAAILDGIERANQHVHTLKTGAATTLVVVEIDGKSIRPYHIGDSQVLMVGNRGKIKLQTPSHSPVGYAVEAGVLSEAQAIVHEDRHIVSNVVGAHDMHIEMGSRKTFAPRDTLLMASDGVFDNLHVEEIVELIRRGTLEDAARSVVECASQRMANSDESHPSKPDDLTFIMFRLGR